MKTIIEHYGSAILVFIVVIALIGVLVFLTKSNGVVSTAFSNLITNFFTTASSSVSGT